MDDSGYIMNFWSILSITPLKASVNKLPGKDSAILGEWLKYRTIILSAPAYTFYL